jgi:alkanesulfonate monooxygenase SsuD/methylene tetrahydromethanopterin reductase-like flavin-dependent oxidoreductase (luciferase family)
VTIAVNATFVPGATARDALTVAEGMGLSGVSAAHVGRFFLLGDDDAVVARAQEYADAGAEEIILGCPPGDERALDTFTTAAARLLPRLRALRPAVVTR